MLKNMLKNNKLKWLIGILGALGVATATGVTITINIQPNFESAEYKAEIEYADEQLPATIIDDRGETVETVEYNGEEIPTVEEVDGGLFKDEVTGVSVIDDEYTDLGAYIETFDTSTPEAFRDATLGLCVYASNYWGAQCVSLARSYWFSYAGRDVSTCGTGMAKGMMNCSEQNAGDDFVVYWADSKGDIQSGDWLVFDGGQYGHVGMALGPVVNGYVALLGENQGGRACEKGGAATNIINISIKNLIGFYRPKAYIKPEPTPPAPEPTPEPTPEPVGPCKRWEVKKGDTMGKIMKTCLGKVQWGAKMNEYAKHWYSVKYKKYPTVYDGWASKGRYGLFAGDIIEYR